MIAGGSDDLTGPWPQAPDPSAPPRRLLMPVLLVCLAWVVFNLAGPVHPGRYLLRTLGSLALMFGYACLSFGNVARSRRPYRGPVGLAVRRAAFAGWPSPQAAHAALSLPFVLAYLVTAAHQLPLLTDGVGHGLFWFVMAVLQADLIVMLVVVVPLGTALVASVLIAPDRPRIELTRRGVVSRQLFGSRTFPWNAFDPDQPVRVTPMGQLDLAVDRAAVVRTGLAYRSNRLAWPYQSMSIEFITNVITYYVNQPQRRAGIGTEDGYAELLAAVGGPTQG